MPINLGPAMQVNKTWQRLSVLSLKFVWLYVVPFPWHQLLPCLKGDYDLFLVLFQILTLGIFYDLFQPSEPWGLKSWPGSARKAIQLKKLRIKKRR